jgi:type IX secretion system PorP/SprF family membrane protein
MKKLAFTYTTFPILIICLCSLTSFNLVAQQLQNEIFYNQNLFTMNPAAAGNRGNLEITSTYRDQWSGFKGAPETSKISAHALMTNSVGLGVNLEQNQSGVLKYTRADMNFSYRVGFSDKESLGFGAKLGYSRNTLDNQNMVVKVENDPLLYNSNFLDESMIYYGFGVHYNRDKFNLHLATPFLYNSQEERFFQSMLALTSYDFYLSDNIWKLQPSVLYRYTAHTPHQADFNLTADWNRKMWSMVSYRTNKSVILSLGFIVKNFSFGYGIEINGKKFSSANSLSNEIMIQYEPNITFNKKTARYQNSKHI